MEVNTYKSRLIIREVNYEDSVPLAKILVKRPKTVLLVYTIITIVIGLQIQNVYMQSDLTMFLPENDRQYNYGIKLIKNSRLVLLSSSMLKQMTSVIHTFYMKWTHGY